MYEQAGSLVEAALANVVIGKGHSAVAVRKADAGRSGLTNQVVRFTVVCTIKVHVAHLDSAIKSR
jgi:hypothetical protein